MASLGRTRSVVLAVQRGLQGRRRRLDELRAEVFVDDISDQKRDTRVLIYLTVRARQPWFAVAWHDVCRLLRGAEHPEENEVWRRHVHRLGLDDAHRRPSCRLVRP